MSKLERFNLAPASLQETEPSHPAQESGSEEKEDQEFVPMTRENTYIADLDVEHPIRKNTKRRSSLSKDERIELKGMIQSVCSLAAKNGKRYAQINFLNGTRVYTFKLNQSKTNYIPIRVTHSDVVDDLASKFD